MKNLIFMSILLMMTVACSKETNHYGACYTDYSKDRDDARPDWLVIGDSISLGYMGHLKTLNPEKELIHNPCNGRSSYNGRLNIEAWLDMRNNWSLVTFNHGAWDANPKWGITDDQYRDNLTYIARAIKNSGKVDRIVYILTTEIDITVAIPDGTEQRLNQIALEVMNNEGIEVIDLHSVSVSLTRPDGLHYDGIGSSILAEEINKQIKE